MRKAPGFASLVFFLLCALPCWGQFRSYDLPQIANGSFGDVTFRTSFILVNTSNTYTQAILSLTDDEGNPLSVGLGGLGTGSRFNIGLNGGTTMVLETDGRGNGAIGAAVVTAVSKIGVAAIFTVYDAAGNFLTESGVTSSERINEFDVPVDSTGSRLTGLALFSPEADASLKMSLIDPSGTEIDTATQLLARGSHMASFVGIPGQLFPAAANFQGTLRVRSTSPISALALRQYRDSSRISYTSLPVADRSSPTLIHTLPQVANGAYGSLGFKTTFLVINTSDTAAKVVLTLTQDDGSPWSLAFPGIDRTADDGTFAFTLATGALLLLESDGSGPGRSGAATLTSDVPVAASAILTAVDPQGAFQTETGVGDAQVLTTMTLPVDVTGSSDTGMAFFNPGTEQVTLSFSLLDYAGTITATKTLSFGSKAHLATFVDQLFPGTRNFRGSMTISATTPVAAVALRQNSPRADLVTYTTLPCASGVALGVAPVLPLLTKSETGIDAILGATVNSTLAAGYKLSGTITGAGILQSVSATSLSESYYGRVDAPSGRYVIVVPTGIYNLRVTYSPPGVELTSSVFAYYTSPLPVQVTRDTTFDLAVPSLESTRVSPHISGLSSLPPSSGVQCMFISASISFPLFGRFPLDDNGDCDAILPAGYYQVGVSLSLLQGGSLNFANIGTLEVGGSSVSESFSIPPTAQVYGTVQFAGLQSFPPGPGSISVQAEEFAGGTTTDMIGKYQLILARDQSYLFSVTFPVAQDNTSFGYIRYPAAPNPIEVGGDITYDFNIPVLPAQVYISGQVTDASGNGVANVSVSVSSLALMGAADTAFSGATKTDASGRYSVPVLSGTGYQIRFVPPTPTS